MGDNKLPVPSQLEKQLEKCKTMRPFDYYKPRTKTPAVRFVSFGVGLSVCLRYIFVFVLFLL